MRAGRVLAASAGVIATKKRLDKLLAERGSFSSRSRAAAAVLAGEVKVDGRLITKAGAAVEEDAGIEVAPAPRYVSRGGLKLERALAAFGVDVEGMVVLDAGASTGGFSDCLLAHGARKVYAVDVGYGQLHWRLRQDPRVVVMERVNVRHLDCGMLGEQPDFAVFDLSFISLKKVIPPVIECLRPGFGIIALVKPQFEAGRGNVGKGGVVRDPGVHRQVLLDVWQFAEGCGLRVEGLTDSGLPGPKGNIEFPVYLRDGRGRPAADPGERQRVVDGVVERVHGRKQEA